MCTLRLGTQPLQKAQLHLLDDLDFANSEDMLSMAVSGVV